MSDNKHNDQHVLPLWTYLNVGIALLCLTGLTVWAASIDMGGWNAIVAFALAATKALLVAFIFMHLWYDRKLFLVIFSAGILFLAVLISLTMFDILSRGDIEPQSAGPINKNAAMYGHAVDTTTTDSTAVPADVIDSTLADSSAADTAESSHQ